MQTCCVWGRRLIGSSKPNLKSDPSKDGKNHKQHVFFDWSNCPTFQTQTRCDDTVAYLLTELISTDVLSPRSKASLLINLSSVFLAVTMEEETKVLESAPAPTPLLERRVRRRQPVASVLKSKLKEGMSCSVPRIRSTLTGFFPVMRWLPKYKLREYIWGDLMSGVIVGIILVPQAIAYCLLAGVDPIYGLYTSFYANIIYFLMGTSRHVSVGIFSLMSLMVGQVIHHTE